MKYLILITLFCTQVFASDLELNVSSKGISELLKAAPSKVENISLDNLNLDIPLLGKIEIPKAKLALNFKKLSVQPINDALKGTLSFTNLSLQIDKFTLTKKITKHKRVCHNTALKLTNDFDLNLNLSLKKQQGRFKLVSNQFDIALKKNNVSSEGPDACFNDRGSKRRFMKWITHKIINSPKILNFALSSASAMIVAELEKELNKQLTPLTIPITVPKLFFLESRKLVISSDVETFKLSPRGLKLALNAQVSNASDKSNLRASKIIKYAHVKIDPRILNNAVNVFLGDRAPGELLKWHKLKAVYSFLPAIENLETTHDMVKLMVSFGEFDFSVPKDGELLINIKDLAFILETQIDNEYREYFRFTLNSHFTLRPLIDHQRKLRLRSTIHAFTLDGAFADGTAVTSENFDHQGLRDGIFDLFKTLVDDDSTLYQPVKIPNFEIANGVKMTIQKLGTKKGKIYGVLSSEL